MIAHQAELRLLATAGEAEAVARDGEAREIDSLVDQLRVPEAQKSAALTWGWVATLTIDLPAYDTWALHPSSVNHLRTLFDGRCPLVSRNDEVLCVSYLTPAGGDADTTLAAAASRLVAKTVGLGQDAVRAVNVDAASPPPQRQPELSIVR